MCSLYSLYLSLHFTFVGAFGVVYGAVISNGWKHETVAVKTVKGESLLN